MKTPEPNGFGLRGWLIANAVFSAISGLIMLMSAGRLPTLLGAGSTTVYFAVGGGLCMYSARLFWLSRGQVPRREANLIVVGDVVWVVLSLGLMASGALSRAGVLIVGAVAVVIAVFAAGQWAGLRRLTCTAALLAGSLVVDGHGRLEAQTLPELPRTEELRVLPPRSTPAVDRLLDRVESAHAAKDTEAFVSLFVADFRQVDVNRRVHVFGRDAWREQTALINAAHRDMGRRHHGRAVVGNWVVAEIEWWGTVRGEALGGDGEDRVIYADYVSLQRQLEWPRTTGEIGGQADATSTRSRRGSGEMSMTPPSASWVTTGEPGVAELRAAVRRRGWVDRLVSCNSDSLSTESDDAPLWQGATTRNSSAISRRSKAARADAASLEYQRITVTGH